MESEVTRLRKEGKLNEAFTMAKARLTECDNDAGKKDMFWVCNDLLKRNNWKASEITESLQVVMQEMVNGVSRVDDVMRENYGWTLARMLKENYVEYGSPKSRKMLAEYLALKVKCPSSLHSFILLVATKMMEVFADFRFVPFLRLWGMENIRPEDREARNDAMGHRFPSLLECVAKAYALSLLYHPQDELSIEQEMLLTPILEAKGYKPVMQMVATKVFLADVKGRKMRFVKLVAPDGTEGSCEIHTLVNHQRLRFDDIPGMLFDVLTVVPKREAQNDVAESPLRIVAAMVSGKRMEEVFPKNVGYVERIDTLHNHIHIYDRFSRHMVAESSRLRAKQGQFVEFFPIVPKVDKFKSAVINRILPDYDGPEAFGLREVRVSYSNSEKGYCAWEMNAGNDDLTVRGGELMAEKGFISLQTIQAMGASMPQPGDRLKLVVFMKRGKDGVKRPHVVHFVYDT